MSQVAMPEWLARRDATAGAWVVEQGQPVRGDAWTNNVERVMRVPVGADEQSRLIRAHEMMHARVSPFDMSAAQEYGLSIETIKCAEEYRVNTLVGVAGFDLENLTDGSETTWGKRHAESKDWNAIVTSVAVLAGTKGCADFLRGIRTVNGDLAKAAREVEKAVIDQFTRIARRHVYARGRGRKAITQASKEAAAREVGSTVLTPNGLPEGFVTFTIPLARMLEGMMIQDNDGVPDPENGGEIESPEIPTPEDIKDIGKIGEAGHFAPLLLDTDVVLSRRVDGRIGKRRVASNVGRNPRRMSRMLTDPERRVFDKKIRGKGGMVVIDQSGSMALTEEKLWAIIQAAPGCTIIGYSHRPGHSTTPNVWVLADRGKVCDTVRRGNGGNGVDAPALRFAATKRRSSEPFIWVCDGYVTDGKEDKSYPNLNEECARLVVRHGIHMVQNVEEATSALSKVVRNNLPAKAVGYVVGTAAWRQGRPTI
jgi:hypothetical protein